MEDIKKYMPSFASAALLCVFLYVLHPFFGYYLEADAIGYLTVAQRYAEGDIFRAINGYWSPFSCWLVAVAIKTGWAPAVGAIIVNAMAAVGFLFFNQSYLLKFQLSRTMQWMLNGALVIFLCYAVYLQWFADLWMCFFLLCTLRLMISDRFARKPLYWVACGLTAGLAYLSKAYALPFFIMMAVVFVLLTIKRNEERKKITGILFSVLIAGVLAFTWAWHLHGKYHVWTISTAGQFNSSWAMSGKQHWKDEYKYLVPPIYGDSPYLWEDPYLVAKMEGHKGSFIYFVASQGARIGMNLVKNISNMNAISFVFMFSVLVAAGVAFSKRVRSQFPEGAELLAWAMLLFPVGYLLVMPREVTEERFFWCLIPLSMGFTGVVLQRTAVLVERKWLRTIGVMLFAVSYVCNPIMMMKEMYRDGIEDYKLAKFMRGGRFTSNATPGAEKLTVIRIAYWQKAQYYHPINNPTQEQLFAEMKMNDVQYYLHFSRKADRAGYVLRDADGNISVPFADVEGRFRMFIFD